MNYLLVVPRCMGAFIYKQTPAESTSGFTTYHRGLTVHRMNHVNFFREIVIRWPSDVFDFDNLDDHGNSEALKAETFFDGREQNRNSGHSVYSV